MKTKTAFLQIFGDDPVIKKFRDFYWETTKQSVHGEIKEKRLIAV